MMNEINVIEKITFSHEKNGFYELDNCPLSRIVNEVGKNIVEDINEGSDLNELVDKYCDNEFTKKDMFFFLGDLRVLEYIDFSNDYFKDVLSEEKVKVVGDKEYVDVSKFFEENAKNVTYPSDLAISYYNVMTMRTRSFSNKETFLFDEDENGIISVMGVQGFATDASPIVINSLLTKSGCIDDLTEFYYKAEDFFKRRNKRKVKVLFESADIPTDMKEFFEKTGFVFEANLKFENGDHDLVSFCKLLK